MTSCCAIVLAAGAGRRAGGPKADAIVDGRRLLDRAVATAHAGGCTEVIAVVRAGTVVDSADALVNPDPDRGLSSSLRLGLAEAERTVADAVIVLLVDMPGISATAVRRVVDARDPDGRARLWFATFDGRRAHPVRIDRALWGDVAASASGDRGAAAFAAENVDFVREIDCDGVGDPRDLDTAVDLLRWTEKRAGPGGS